MPETIEMHDKQAQAQGSHDVEEKADHAEADENYPPSKVSIPTILCIYLAFLLCALDRTIIGVAIPAISNEFKSFGDISWYESAFLLTSCVFQLPTGKVYKYFSAKWTLVLNVVIFEAGSILCAAAPSSKALIVGRALSGIGTAAITTGGQVIITNLFPLRKRPMYLGFLGAIFGIASIMGPLVGGAFTSNVSWRWCFWINAPIGGLALAGLVFVLPPMPPPSQIEGTFVEMVKKFDPAGNILLAPGIVCLLLAVQWGGVRYAWSNGQVVALLVVGAVLLIGFVGTQIWQKENATIPPRIISQRSIAAGTVTTIGFGASLIITSFYLPIWQQAIKGTSAGNAGVRLLPYFLSTVLAVIGSGIAVSKLGYYTPFLIGGCAIMIVASGLLTTFSVGSGIGEWIGYPVLIGVGMGLALAQCQNAAQTVLSKADISTGATLLAFATSFGGAIFVSVAQTVLSNTLVSQLSQTLPGFDASIISNTGATDLKKQVPRDQLPTVLRAYNTGIDNVFYCSLATSCLALIASCFVEWKSVLAKQPSPSEESKESKDAI